jgi:hypothetical protein
MSVTTFEGVIENGRVQLPQGVSLPERKIVYVIVPETDTPTERTHSGLRLTNPADAAKFEMKVTWGEES